MHSATRNESIDSRTKRSLHKGFGMTRQITLLSPHELTSAHRITRFGLTTLLLSLLLTSCAISEGEEEELTDDPGDGTLIALTAQDAFCPAGFTFDSANQLCLSATEAAGPFPASMIAFCKRNVPNRADGSNACETTLTGAVNTRWARSLAISGRNATLQANGCPSGTSPHPTVGYCADSGNIYGPFSREDVDFCKSKSGGAACETNRIAPSFAKPKTGGGSGEWSYIMPVDHGVRADSLGGGHFGASRSNSAGTHSGVDFLAPVGTPLLSICDSNDVQTGVDPGGYGNWVQISCLVPARLTGGQTMWASAFYAHMNSVSVSTGSIVSKGARIGTVGKTGNAAGSGINAHVHWEVTIHSTQSAARNDGHASSDNTGNAASTAFASSFASACINPDGITAVTGPVMRGRRPDPYLLLICTVRGKPAITAAPQVQSVLQRWSSHFTARAYDINVGRL
jgi:Peptidase family M23